ncbi:MAG: FUSC family protein [Sarcina sp.]
MAIKINKSNIKTNTIVFIAIIVFITIFKTIFGAENSVVGITLIISTLVLMQRDLTKNPVRNLLGLMIFNVLMGIFCYLSVMNVWTAIILNFIALLSIGYLCSSNLRTSVVVPFGLQYLFMLFEPVHGHAFNQRLIALAVGAVFIMAIQFLVNGNKVKKAFNPLMIGIFTDLENSISEKKVNCKSVFIKLDSLKKMILDRRKKGYYLSEESKIITNIIWAIERTTIVMEEHKDLIINNEKFKNHLLELLNTLKTALKTNNKDILNKNFFEGSVQEEAKEVCLILNELKIILLDLWILDKHNQYDYSVEIPSYFNKRTAFKRAFKLSTLKVSYAVRLAIIGTIAIFIVQFFDLSQGKWMAYTIFSLIQPYAEHSKERLKDRIEGTLVGALIVIVLFLIVKNPSARSLVVLAAGYLNPFAEGYKSMIVLVTISVIASTALVGGTLHVGLTRIFFVICGAVLAFIGSNYIIPYRIKNGNDEILLHYDEIKKILKYEVENKNANDAIKALYLMPSFFEEKIKSVNNGEELKRLMNRIDSERKEINDLYLKYISYLYKEKECRWV